MHFTKPFLVLLAAIALVTPIPNIRSNGRPGRSISLRRRYTLLSDGIINHQRARRELAFLESKHSNSLSAYSRNAGRPHESTSTKREEQTVDLTNSNSRLWFGEISVGSQTFTVDFDTGSSDLILPGFNCTENCSGHALYRADSPEAVATGSSFALSYGDGSTISGTVFTDTVTLGGLKASPQALGAATSYSKSMDHSQFAPDGLLGLAWPQIAVITTTAPTLISLQKEGLVSGGFTFKLSGSTPVFELGISEPSPSKSRISTMPVTHQGFWQIELDTVNIQGKGVVFKQPAIIDTGSTFISGDPTSVQTFYSSIPGYKNASDFGTGFYTFPCSSSPSVSLTFGGVSYDISKSFNIGLVATGSSDCVGGIVASHVHAWVIGDVFLSTVEAQFSIEKSTITFLQEK